MDACSDIILLQEKKQNFLSSPAKNILIKAGLIIKYKNTVSKHFISGRQRIKIKASLPPHSRQGVVSLL